MARPGPRRVHPAGRAAACRFRPGAYWRERSLAASAEPAAGAAAPAGVLPGFRHARRQHPGSPGADGAGAPRRPVRLSFRGVVAAAARLRNPAGERARAARDAGNLRHPGQPLAPADGGRGRPLVLLRPGGVLRIGAGLPPAAANCPHGAGAGPGAAGGRHGRRRAWGAGLRLVLPFSMVHARGDRRRPGAPGGAIARAGRGAAAARSCLDAGKPAGAAGRSAAREPLHGRGIAACPAGRHRRGGLAGGAWRAVGGADGDGRPQHHGDLCPASLRDAGVVHPSQAAASGTGPRPGWCSWRPARRCCPCCWAGSLHGSPACSTCRHGRG